MGNGNSIECSQFTRFIVTTVRGNLMPGTDSSHDIGTFDGTRFTNIYGDTLYGDGSNLTNLPTQVSIGNNADNRVITGGSGKLKWCSTY